MEKGDRGEQEAVGDGTTSRSVKAFQLVILVTVRKGNDQGVA